MLRNWQAARLLVRAATKPEARNLPVQLRLSAVRNASSGITTKGPASELVPMLRGLIPGPANNYKLFLLANLALAGALLFRHYNQGENLRLQEHYYHKIVESGYSYWKDFDNIRQPKYAKVLAAGPCGDQFKEAYLCAVFGEGENCEGKFGEFLQCAQSVPELLHDQLPNGDLNWASKLTLWKLLNQKKAWEDLVASVGPAELDMADVLDEYRARHVLGENATESEVTSFKEKFGKVRDAFWAEVQALFDGEKKDVGRVRQLYNQLKNEYSIPLDLWLSVMKDYDVEEFDEMLTNHRKEYGTLAYRMLRFNQVDEVRAGAPEDIKENNPCGQKFLNWYKCLSEKGESQACADHVDELYFCRAANYKQVWPEVKMLEKPACCYKAELDRIQEAQGYQPVIS